MEASDLKKLKELEEENVKLKRMYANLALDLEAVRYIIEKKALKPCQKRSIIKEIKEEKQIGISRSSSSYQSIKDDGKVNGAQ